jgi:hypothetical protein
MTQIQLATGFLDVEVDFPITVSFSDIVKRGQRSGGYSNTIEVKGNENNRTLLGLYFDVDLENDTFNRNVKTECSIIQDGVEVFNGFIQLLEITRVNKHRNSNEKLFNYKVFVFDEVGNFFNSMADFELSDLTFPELNHNFNRENIIDSWDNTEGYIYPVYAKPDSTYTLRDFKPALFEWEYFKKIFALHGYTFTFSDYDIDTIRMDRRIVPYNGKANNEVLTATLQNQYKVVGEQPLYDELIAQTMPYGFLPNPTNILPSVLQSYAATQQRIELDILQDIQGQWDGSNDQLVNLSGAERTFTFLSNYSVTTRCRAYDDTNTLLPDFRIVKLSTTSRIEFYVTLVIQSTTTPSKALILDVGTPIESFTATQTLVGGSGSWVDLGTAQISSTGQLGLMDVNETFVVTPLIFARAFNNANQIITSNFGILPFSTIGFYTNQEGYRLDDGSNNNIRLEFDIEINNLQLQAIPNIEELIQGAPVIVDAFIPRSIKQRDFISTIIKSYNLFFEPDPDNEKNIIISTRDSYLDAGDEWDWTRKLAEDQNNSITFLSNDVAREQLYTYKEDTDIINTAYQSQIKEVYGQAKLILDNEYIKGVDENELIYSPTPNIQSAIGLTLPAIDGINPDMNVRVLLNNGLKPCSPMSFYDSLLPDTTPQIVNQTLHTSMFDNDQQPNFSICFDAPKYLFHNTQQGQTTNYLYYLHHKREVTNLNNGKMLVGYFDITETDFQRLARRLNWSIYIKDNGWLYVNKVDKYNAGKRTLTRVELITLDDETDLKLPTTIGVGTLPPSSIANNQIVGNFLDAVQASTNIVLFPTFTDVFGSYNFVSAQGVKVMGSQNKVYADGATVIGNNNTVFKEAVGSITIGQGGRTIEEGVIISGTKI